MSRLKYADWDPKRGTVAGYTVDDGGLLERAEFIINNFEPVDRGGLPLKNDHKTVTLVGWSHAKAASFNGGHVLVALK